MMSVGNSAYLIKSADDHRAIITDKLDRIIRKSVDISSLTLDDPSLVSDLKVHLCFSSNLNSDSEICDYYHKSSVVIPRR